jgi:hypothetical protein
MIVDIHPAPRGIFGYAKKLAAKKEIIFGLVISYFIPQIVAGIGLP